MAKKTLLILVGIVFLLFPTIGFGQELAEEQILKVGSCDDDIKGLDPYYFVGTSGEPMLRAIYEGLVRFNFGNIALDKTEPAIAESWEISSDGLVWTFHLRKGVQFHHGYGECTAEDVKFSIERLDEGSPNHGDYKTIESITCVDSYTVQFNMVAPDPFFLYKLGNYHGGYVLSRKAVEEEGEGFRSSPVGTGPFEFSEWIAKEKVVLVRNDKYWRGSPILERIEFLFMPDYNTRTLALESGAIDITTEGIDEEEWVTSERAKGIIVDCVGFDMPMRLHFNMTVKPLDDIRVRMALAYASRRQDFLDYNGPSLTKPQISPLPPGMYSSISEGLPLYEYNLEKAKQLLAEAGYPNGFDLGTTYSSVRPLYLDPLEILQAQWAKVGVTFDIEPVAHQEYHSLVRQNLNPIVCYPGPRATPDMVFTQYLHSDATVGKDTAITNFSHYGDIDCDGDGTIDGVDEYIEKARGEMNLERQKALYAIAQLQVLLDLPIYPLRVMASVQARNSWVDLGHEVYQQTWINGYAYTEKTRILKHKV